MFALYIHIPFCARRCGYCDFFSTTRPERRGDYAGAAAAEMERERGFLPEGKLHTVYFGGGTPSLLAPEHLGTLLSTARRLWDCTALAEITLEANPDDLTPDYLAAVRALGIDRLSIGIQSLDDGLLKFMNRRHTAAAAVQAVQEAREAGFGNLSIDLIYGIPGLTGELWQRTLESAVALQPEHISAYCLTVEPGTAFARQNVEPAAEEDAARQYGALREMLAGAGYEHYEISNFALPHRRSRHNGAYWTGAAYLGIGPSAHSYDGGRTRRWNDQTLEAYLAGPAYRSETLSDDELYDEYLMTRLRTAAGVSETEIAVRFGARRSLYFEKCASGPLAAGTLVKIDGNYVIPPEKIFVSDGIICSLLAK